MQLKVGVGVHFLNTSLVFTCPILAGKRRLRGPIGEVGLLWFPEALASRNLAAAAATTRLRLRSLLLRPILGLCLRLVGALVFAARLCFLVLV